MYHHLYATFVLSSIDSLLNGGLGHVHTKWTCVSASVCVVYGRVHAICMYNIYCIHDRADETMLHVQNATIAWVISRVWIYLLPPTGTSLYIWLFRLCMRPVWSSPFATLYVRLWTIFGQARRCTKCALCEWDNCFAICMRERTQGDRWNISHEGRGGREQAQATNFRYKMVVSII